MSTTALEERIPAPDGEAPEARLLAHLDAERVRQALRDLSDEQQEVLVLRFGQRLSIQETADIMGKGVGAIELLQFRATERLRKVLEAH